jgi:hypothetical protein
MCEDCKDTGEVMVRYNFAGRQQLVASPCEACCPHDEHDHGICLDCGKDNYEDMAARAYDRYKDSVKYGD